ncbi:DUF3604 domain-containing protein [Candidatus Pelagadaptatus aseana]|uniref:DUF3604 domain-containing protein n=1 Tax=Candidatus Pelagadaptatus aseana TaxID=3120508 RepID=UPI003C6F48AC
MMFTRQICLLFLLTFAIDGWAENPKDESKQLLFGDTHLHTSLSFDAFLNSNRSAGPETAYRWAKGLPVIHPFTKARVQINEPLDFLVIADHAEGMGFVKSYIQDDVALPDLGWWGNLKRWIALQVLTNAMEDEQDGSDVFASVLPKAPAKVGGDPVQDANNSLEDALGDTSVIETHVWHQSVDAAERHNQPGVFTTFAGWEWSSIPVGANLHRVVFTPDGPDKTKQFLPYGSDDSQYPQDLWAWLQQLEQRDGTRFLAIPHNSNISKGYMFAETTLKGEPMTADYAQVRMKWEPVVEITQYKGDSETHPDLSPDDEFADFETYKHYIQQIVKSYKVAKADYVRSGLMTGLTLEAQTGVNPFQFGLIGSTDSHTGLAAYEEPNYWGKFGRDSIPSAKTNDGIVAGGPSGWDMGAQGLAAVWATENTRDAIFAAFKRREVYATTGPRMKVRLFAGWDFTEADLASPDFARIGYRKGVPMGSHLVGHKEGETPRFMIRAVKGPNNANLDRVQVIKGWLDASGQVQEKVYDVAWSGERTLDAAGKLPPVGNTVNLTDGRYDNRIGSAELVALWQDPEFDATERAFYYVRVLQIPTARHSTLDAIALGVKPSVRHPQTIQERAYTSPVWYSPR